MEMPFASDVIVHGLLFAAALLQGVTGIGYALIAGPVLLLALDDAAAVPITAALCWMLSVLLIPGAARFADRRMLLRFIVASVAASPLGLALFLVADPPALKLMAGVVIGALTAAMLSNAAAFASAPGARDDYAAGAVAGAMGGALSILGPPISLRMTAQRMPKARNRATVLAYFVLVYPVVFCGQSLISGGDGTAALTQALGYTPATIAGAIGGWLLAPLVSEALFRNVVVAILILTTASLIVDGLWSIAGWEARHGGV